MAAGRAAAEAALGATGVDALLGAEAAFAEADAATASARLLGDLGPDPEVRAAGAGCAAALAAWSAERFADPRLARAAQVASETAASQELKSLAALYAESCKLGGAGLPLPERRRLRRLRSELERVEASFVQALATEQTWLSLTPSEQRLLPASLSAAMNRGRLRVDDSTQDAFLRQMPSADARRRFYRAWQRRGGAANVRRLQRALVLRRAIARLLGFSSWSELRAKGAMIGSPERAATLVARVGEKLRPRARAELAALAPEGGLAAWDVPWAQEHLSGPAGAPDPDEVRRAFPLDQTLPAMLRVLEQLLGLQIRQIKADGWAAGVSLYEIADGDAAMAFLYLDLEPRSGKFTRPAHFPIRAGRTLPDGSRELPVSAIAGNGPAHRPGEPALLSHRELVELFHELGHAMHESLSTARFAALAGTRVRGDFVEAPAQVLEGLGWEPSVLKQVSSGISETLLAGLLARRHSWDGLFWTRQSLLASYDLALHGERVPAEPTALWFELAGRLTPLPQAPGTLPEASFLFEMGGYDARYYGYLWTQVIARAVFEQLSSKEGLDRKAFQRFRREVLEPGGTIEPNELIQRYLGQAPSESAFLAELTRELPAAPP